VGLVTVPLAPRYHKTWSDFVCTLRRVGVASFGYHKTNDNRADATDLKLRFLRFPCFSKAINSNAMTWVNRGKIASFACSS
jgi:hypothetical protein